MAPRVLAQVVLPVEPFAALGAHVSLLARVYHEVQRQLLLPLERLEANRAHVRPLRIVALLVSSQVILALQPSAANVADESTLQRVTQQMLLKQLALRISHVTLGTAVQR